MLSLKLVTRKLAFDLYTLFYYHRDTYCQLLNYIACALLIEGIEKHPKSYLYIQYEFSRHTINTSKYIDPFVRDCLNACDDRYYWTRARRANAIARLKVIRDNATAWLFPGYFVPKRCKVIEEELIQAVFHPDRVAHMGGMHWLDAIE